jgi:hypothetical protein
MTAVAIESRTSGPDASNGDDIVHTCCCSDETVALCGASLEDEPAEELPSSPDDCAVCEDLAVTPGCNHCPKMPRFRMTAVQHDAMAIDFDAIDREYRARVELVAGDWFRGDEDLEKFIAALMDARRGPLDLIHQDDVRVRLTEDTVKGPRISINPNRYSALWATCKSHGLIDFYRDASGEIVHEKSTTSTTGNNNKLFPVRRWIGA